MTGNGCVSKFLRRGVDGNHLMRLKSGTSVFKFLQCSVDGALGQVQTPYFTWTESNANEKNPLISFISIRFGSCEVRRLNLALNTKKPQRHWQRELHQTKGLLSRTMALHVRYKSLYISLPSSAQQQREMTKF